MVKNRKRLTPLALAAWVLLIAAPVLACSVPVFRYALERWEPSAYVVFVFHRADLAGADKQAVEIIQKASYAVQDPMAPEAAGPKANLFVQVVDVDDEMDEFTSAIWEGQGNPDLPWTIVLYPAKTMQPPGPVAWAGRLTPANAKELLVSPARTEIAKRIVSGQSAVWVFLGDEKGATALEAELKKVEKKVELPQMDPVDPQWGVGATPIEQLQKDLRIEFSVLRVDPSDPAEKTLVNLLIGMEPDLKLKQGDEAITFPVFGQGRALHAFVGKGITPENILEAAAFLTGPCSCTIKDQNPGVDLLMTADWGQAKAQGSRLQIVDVPPDLSGNVSPANVLSAPGTAPAKAGPTSLTNAPASGPAAATSSPAAEAGQEKTLTRDALVVAGLVAIVTIVLAVYVRGQSSGS